MLRIPFKWLKWALVALLILLFAALGVRVWLSQQGPALAEWHTFLPDEMQADEIHQASWRRYVERENQLFAAVHQQVVAQHSGGKLNRYSPASPVNAQTYADDWNRSHLLLPDGQAIGVAVLLHGLTDSPYSLAHLAREFRQRGYVTVVPRLPGHGTVPGSLTNVRWQQWQAATQLAVREGVRLAPGKPLIVVGYSNGGALAMQYSLDALQHNVATPAPLRIILLSPMIGVSGYARYAGLAGLPALLPAFAKSAWLSTGAEYNPYKYNSFPVNAARQSWLLTRQVQNALREASRQHELAGLAPVLTFQSVADATVSTRSVVTDLYDRLPQNGSELVLFDVNQAAKWQMLMRDGQRNAHRTLLSNGARNYCTQLLTNRSAATNELEIQLTQAGQQTRQILLPGLHYPDDMFSLSHVALPFPEDDALYGNRPPSSVQPGINLTALTPRGERGVLSENLDSLMRQSFNPFYSWMVQQIWPFVAENPAQSLCGLPAPQAGDTVAR
ncbi:MAG TPA: alpha/beta hydrolase [Buttiauxella sp.]